MVLDEWLSLCIEKLKSSRIEWVEYKIIVSLTLKTFYSESLCINENNMFLVFDSFKSIIWRLE